MTESFLSGMYIKFIKGVNCEGESPTRIGSWSRSLKPERQKYLGAKIQSKMNKKQGKIYKQFFISNFFCFQFFSKKYFFKKTPVSGQNTGVPASGLRFYRSSGTGASGRSPAGAPVIFTGGKNCPPVHPYVRGSRVPFRRKIEEIGDFELMNIHSDLDVS